MKNNLNRFSSPEQKRDAADIVFENLINYLFDKVVLISLIFSEALNTDGSSITSTSDFIGTSRITDTSEGRYTDTGKNSRMRCSFYLENPDSLIGYILSPAVYDSFGSLNTLESMSILRSYVGLKFNQGLIQVAVKESGKTEVVFPTLFSFSGTGPTDTYELEIIHNSNFTDIYINKEIVGSYATDMIGSVQSTKTFLPLLSPAKSSDGSSVGIVVENYQFIQEK